MNTTDATTLVSEQAPIDLIGAELPHESAVLHVTGRARYIDDLAVPADCLHVATGVSTIAHGKLVHLDLSQVRSAPGVIDVITAEDVPGDLDIGAIFPGDPLLVSDTISYIGQPLFAVAATSLVLAKRAAALAVIKFEPLPHRIDALEAYQSQDFVLPSRTWLSGNPEQALTDCHTVIEGDLLIRGQEHFYLEGQVSLAFPGDDGGIHVLTSSQHPHEVQELVARVLALPMHRIQAECRRMGGGFGGKESQAAPLACMAAVFAHRLGRAVKYRMPRADDMVQTGKRHDFRNRYRLGADADGVLRVGDFSLVAMCGFSPDLSEGIVDRAMFHVTNGYHFSHSRIAGHRCRTHTVSNTAFRGFGGPQGMITIEAAMDDLAARLGVDPLELRKRNLYRPGASVTPYGQNLTEYVLPSLIEALEHRVDYAARRAAIRAFNDQSPVIKKGFALTPVQFGISFTTTHLNQAGALVSVFTDGSIELSHSGTEMGQGLYTKIAQVVADAFGLPLQSVRNSSTRTDKVPNGSPTAASAGTDMNAWAALDACRRIQSGLADFAATTLGWNADLLQYRDGRVTAGDESMSFQSFVHAAWRARTPLSSTGFYRTPGIHFDKERGIGHPFYYFAHGAAASEVAVDTDTGEYRVLSTDIIQDVGRSLNPAIDLGQIEGGFMQGLGWVTTEELLWTSDGRLASASPATYKIPTAGDLPEHFTVNFHSQDGIQHSIHRSKAVGEPPVMLAISVWCALRDACANAGSQSLARYLPM
ncbi:MAG: xanthine dehydrogenase molybdopterin binding subunit, partial [Pseudomonadales bacterium]